jgi:hypothetical protein
VAERSLDVAVVGAAGVGLAIARQFQGEFGWPCSSAAVSVQAPQAFSLVACASTTTSFVAESRAFSDANPPTVSEQVLRLRSLGLTWQRAQR